MKKHFSILAVAASFTLFGGIVAACSDDSSSPVGSSSGNPLNQTDSGGGSSGSSGSSGGGDSGSDAACSSPPGCFCGTPTTQKEFLNRCTTSVALPVNLTVKPATTANIP